jgi:chloramphenicol-sensitive protein RarD
LAYALAAYAWWGCVPVYFKAVAHVPVFELLAHRAVWTAFLLVFLACLCGRWREVLAAVSSHGSLGVLVVRATLLGTVWLTYLWGVVNDQVLQISMAYFIIPLVSVLLGFLFLGERLRRWQTVSVFLAALAVVYLSVAGGQPPTVAVVMATTFGFYGLLRKKITVDPLVGVAVEMVVLLPFGVVYLLYLGAQDTLVFAGGSWRTAVLLPLIGVFTGVPLIWFARAALRLRLATLGFLLYVTPSLVFILSFTAFGETLTHAYLISFICIWTALLIYSIDAVRASRLRPAITPDTCKTPADGAGSPESGPCRTMTA